jgi:hypothetical protein
MRVGARDFSLYLRPRRKGRPVYYARFPNMELPQMIVAARISLRCWRKKIQLMPQSLLLVRR